MSKVVYLFGAGASCGTLPLVNEMSARLESAIAILTDKNYNLSDSEGYEDDKSTQNWSKLRHQREMIKGLKDLKKICEIHYSVDTYAKKLYIREDKISLKRLKILLSVFFAIEQILNRPNARYDFFFASIIDSIRHLPNNIRILTWNYDSQFEIAFSEFSQKNEILANQKLLKVFCSSPGLMRSDAGGFSIFKLNGSTELHYPHNINPSAFYFNKDANFDLNKNVVDYITELYVKANNDNFLKPSFKFAWEKDPDSNFNDIVIEETKDAKVLVVIGYSFPYFNRTIDKGIISKMDNLRKVYFQSPESKELIERFKSIREDLTDKDLVAITDTKYFYVPHELS